MNISVLPKGVRISNLYESEEFKNFIDKECSKVPTFPIQSLIDIGNGKTSIVYGGKGKSYLEEYVKNLPSYSIDEFYDKIDEFKGYEVVIMNINL